MSDILDQSADIGLDDARKLKQIEEMDPDNLFFLVPGSRLHDIINDPAIEGKD